MKRFAPAVAGVALVASACPLTGYPDRQIPCEPEGEPCPEGQRCVDVDPAPDAIASRCTVVSCGDGIVDVGIEGRPDEECDDANKNELDLCVRCRVVRYTPAIDAIFGFGPGASVAKGTPLGRPTTITIDLDGNILLASAGTNIVTQLIASDDGFNVAQFGGNGTMLGNTVIAEDDRPNEMSTTFVASMAVDTFGSVYLGDLQDNVIRRVDAVSGLVDTVVGTGVRTSVEIDGTRGTETPLDLPATLVVDADGSVLFSERAPGGLAGDRVRRFDPVTGRVSNVELANLGSTIVDDLVIDARGRLHVFHRDAAFVIETTREQQTVDFFIMVTTYERDGDDFVFQQPLRSIRARRQLRTAIGIQEDVFTPRIGAAQSHIATTDGDRFYVLMENHVAELDLRVPEEPGLRFLAVVPDPVDGDGSDGFFGAGDEGGSAIPFAFAPTDLALDGDDLYVTDPGNGVLWRFPVTRDADVDGVPGEDEVIAGILPPPASVPVTNVINEIAVGFARETDGRVGVGVSDDCGAENLLVSGAIEFYLAFPDLDRVLFSNCDSSIAVLAGTGEPGFSGDGGLARSARLDTPTALLRINRPRTDGSVDDAFYVADRNNDRIRRVYEENIDVVPTRPCVADGECGVGFVCRKAAAAVAEDEGVCATPSLLIESFLTRAQGVPLQRPSGLAMDDTRALLIADSGNHRILRHDLETGETTTVFGTGEPGFNGDDGTPTTTQLNEPTAIVYLPLALVSTLAELNGEPLPVQLSGGLLVVTERAGHRVRGAFLPPVPGFPEVLTLAGDGTPGDTDDAGDGTAARLTLPRSLMFAVPDVEQQQLSFFIVDGIDRIREMSLRVNLDLTNLGLTTGLVTRDGRTGLSRNDGGREAAVFRTPSALAVLDEHRLLVVDRATGRIRLVTDLTGDEDSAVKTVAGLPEGTPPPENGAASAPTPPIAALTSATLRDPTDVVVQLDVEPPLAWVTEDRGSAAPGLRRIQLHDLEDPSTWTTDVLVVADLVRPAALAIEAGMLFVADEGAHAVFRVDTDTGAADVVAGRRGVRGDAGDDRTATDALLNGPAGLAVRGDVLLVADTGNNRVRRVQLTPDLDGVITAFLGDGDPASGGEGSPASAFPVLAPRGLAIDNSGNVIVAASNVIRFVQAGVSGVADADADVRSIYGKAPRVAFPDAATRCLDDVVFAPPAPDGRRRIVAVDACLGLVIPLLADGE